MQKLIFRKIKFSTKRLWEIIIFSLKKIEARPNESLSPQLHKFRSEHWIVIEGIAKDELNKKEFILK